VTLPSTISLEQNQAAYFQIDRNTNFSTVGVTVANLSNVPLEENTFCVAFRGTGNNIYLADGTEVLADAKIAHRSHKDKAINQNLNADLAAEASWSVVSNGSNFSLTISADVYAVLQNVTKERNTIQAQTIVFSSSDQVAYVDLNRLDNAPTVVPVSVSDIDSLSDISSPNILVIARSMSDGVVLFDKTKLRADESKILNNHITDQLQDIIDGIVDILNDNAYDEQIEVIAGVAANDNEITGPVTSGTTITMPDDSKDGNSVQSYEVGKGVLEIYLNGVYLRNGDDWQELGVIGDASTTFQIDIDLVVGDILNVRIDTVGGYTAGSGGETNTASNVGGGQGVFKQKVGLNLEFRSLVAGTGVSLSSGTDTITINSSSTTLGITNKSVSGSLTAGDEFITCDANGGNIVLDLPTAASVAGKVYYIKKVDSSINTITLDADALETIDGNTTLVLNIQYQSFTIVSNGTEWFII